MKQKEVDQAVERYINAHAGKNLRMQPHLHFGDVERFYLDFLKTGKLHLSVEIPNSYRMMFLSLYSSFYHLFNADTGKITPVDVDAEAVLERFGEDDVAANLLLFATGNRTLEGL